MYGAKPATHPPCSTHVIPVRMGHHVGTLECTWDPGMSGEPPAGTGAGLSPAYRKSQGSPQGDILLARRHVVVILHFATSQS